MLRTFVLQQPRTCPRVVTHGINTEVYLEIFSHTRGERERELEHREQEREHKCLQSDFKGCEDECLMSAEYRRC
jgi:hypothetical protein